jgi:hypothetical protein
MDDEHERIQSVIQPGESVLWSGRPDPSVIFTGADAILVPYGVFFTAFCVFWTAGVSGTKEAQPFAFIGVVLLLIALYYLVGRFVVKWWLKRRTVYAITNRRAIVIVGSRSVKESNLTGGSRITKLARNGHHLTVTFLGADAARPFGLFNRNMMYPNAGLDSFDFSHRMPVAFYDVSDVEGLRTVLLRVSAPAAPGS